MSKLVYFGLVILVSGVFSFRISETHINLSSKKQRLLATTVQQASKDSTTKNLEAFLNSQLASTPSTASTSYTPISSVTTTSSTYQTSSSPVFSNSNYQTSYTSTPSSNSYVSAPSSNSYTFNLTPPSDKHISNFEAYLNNRSIELAASSSSQVGSDISSPIKTTNTNQLNSVPEPIPVPTSNYTSIPEPTPTPIITPHPIIEYAPEPIPVNQTTSPSQILDSSFNEVSVDFISNGKKGKLEVFKPSKDRNLEDLVKISFSN